jgi:hypothetical protein
MPDAGWATAGWLKLIAAINAIRPDNCLFTIQDRQCATLTHPSAFAKATADKPDTLSHRMGEGRGEGCVACAQTPFDCKAFTVTRR